MIHIMPDKSVRVTSRFPTGHGIVYFDLEHGNGFTFEHDQYRPEISVVRMTHGYRDFSARYGDPTEAAADFADLAAMLADRHDTPPPSSPLLLPPSTFPSGAKRKGWGWKGAVAGLAIGAVGGHFATNWRTADSIPVRAATLGDALPRPGARSDGNFIPDARPVIPTLQLAPPSLAAAPAKSSPPSRPPSPAPSFGLQQ